jgi:hypothetical protein
MCQQSIGIVDTLWLYVHTLCLFGGLKSRSEIPPPRRTSRQVVAALGTAIYGQMSCRTNLPLPRLRDFA